VRRTTDTRGIHSPAPACVSVHTDCRQGSPGTPCEAAAGMALGWRRTLAARGEHESAACPKGASPARQELLDRYHRTQSHAHSARSCSRLRRLSVHALRTRPHRPMQWSPRACGRLSPAPAMRGERIGLPDAAMALPRGTDGVCHALGLDTVREARFLPAFFLRPAAHLTGTARQ
jgi:hypothetical protein